MKASHILSNIVAGLDAADETGKIFLLTIFLAKADGVTALLADVFRHIKHA